jgi:hypothetical protein
LLVWVWGFPVSPRDPPRRGANGTIAALAEVPRDVALLERAARRVFAEQQTHED